MSREKPRIYSEEFKWQVVQDVLNGKYTKEEARRLHNIKSKSAVLYWMRQFARIETKDNFANSNQTSEYQEIMKELSQEEKRIQELEQELKKEKLRADLWQKMVEIAEDKFEIDIQKKYGVKPSAPSKSKTKKK